MPKVPAGWYPKRGEVYWLRLDKNRPALIISNDALNRHALDVCVVPITSVHHGRFTLRVAIGTGDGGLAVIHGQSVIRSRPLINRSLSILPWGDCHLRRSSVSRMESG
jgi:hypothetical protein